MRHISVVLREEVMKGMQRERERERDEEKQCTENASGDK
jgi:hypothetical protein